MQLVRFDPFDLFARSPLKPAGTDAELGFVPAVDVARHDDRWVVHVEVAGMEPDDVDIEVSDGWLKISGERSRDTETSGDGDGDDSPSWVRRERAWGRFERRLALPKDADASSVSASYKNGVLEITLPKSAAATPHKIQIATN